MQKISLATVQQQFSDFLLSADGLEKNPVWALPPERLHVYKRAFWYRVFDSLRDDFPRFTKIIGESESEKIFRDFILNEKDQSHSLFELSRRFPAFIVTAKENCRLPPFVSDLVRWEWLELEAFMNRNIAAPATPPAKESLDPFDSLENAKISLHRSARQSALRYNVITGEAPFHEWPETENIIVWHASSLQWARLDEVGLLLTKLLRSPVSLQEFIAKLEGSQISLDAHQLQSRIAEWTAQGLIVIER